MNDYYVYLHKKSSDGTPFYVGKGNDRRAYSKKGRSPFWKRTVQKYGFDVVILEDGLKESYALDREIYWIDKIGRRNIGTGPLVNITKGGDGGDTFSGRKHTEETKAKMRASMKGIHKGKTPWNKGKSYFNGADNPRSRMVVNLETGIFYDTIKSAAESIGISDRTLRNKLNPNQPEKKNNTSLIYA